MINLFEKLSRNKDLDPDLRSFALLNGEIVLQQIKEKIRNIDPADPSDDWRIIFIISNIFPIGNNVGDDIINQCLHFFIQNEKKFFAGKNWYATVLLFDLFVQHFDIFSPIEKDEFSKSAFSILYENELSNGSDLEVSKDIYLSILYKNKESPVVQRLVSKYLENHPDSNYKEELQAICPPV